MGKSGSASTAKTKGVPPAKGTATSKQAPKTPAIANTKAQAATTGGGRPSKKVAKENQAVASPLAGRAPDDPASLLGDQQSSDVPVGEELSIADENRILRKRHCVAKMAKEKAARRALEDETNHAKTKSIKPLIRPKGEPGSTKKGFNLQNAMELSDNDILYREIIRAVHIEVHVAKLDINVHFAKQDVEKLGHIYRKMRKAFPYLDTCRFPGDWAVADLIKQFLRGQRKSEKRKNAAKQHAGTEDHDSELQSDSPDSDVQEAQEAAKKRKREAWLAIERGPRGWDPSDNEERAGEDEEEEEDSEVEHDPLPPPRKKGRLAHEDLALLALSKARKSSAA